MEIVFAVYHHRSYLMILFCQKVDYKFKTHEFPRTPVQYRHAIDFSGTVDAHIYVCSVKLLMLTFTCMPKYMIK